MKKIFRSGILLSLILGLLLSPAVAEIFRYVDENGRVHFTDKPVEGRSVDKIEVQINSFTAPKVDPFRFDSSLISRRKASTDVVMYSTTWCGYCKKARRYFERNDIPFEEYDVEKSARGKRDYKAMKGRGVPIIVVGEKRMSGFSPDAFDRLYTP